VAVFISAPIVVASHHTHTHTRSRPPFTYRPVTILDNPISSKKYHLTPWSESRWERAYHKIKKGFVLPRVCGTVRRRGEEFDERRRERERERTV
jgi:hypothetical protein